MSESIEIDSRWQCNDVNLEKVKIASCSTGLRCCCLLQLHLLLGKMPFKGAFHLL